MSSSKTATKRTTKRKQRLMAEIQREEEAQLSIHDPVFVRDRAYHSLMEGDYFIFDGADDGLETAMWMYDHGYLLSVDRRIPLRIWFSGRRFHFSGPGPDQNSLEHAVRSHTIAQDLDMWTTAYNVVREVEIAIRFGGKSVRR